MTTMHIAPALEPVDWAQRRRGTIALDHSTGEPRVVVSDETGRFAAISRADELFALMALANAALPEGDPRKLTRELADALCAACDELSAHAEIILKLLRPLAAGGTGAAEREQDALASFQRRCVLLGQAGVVVKALVPPRDD